MRTPLRTSCFIILLIFLADCKQVSYFSSPNDVNATMATVFLLNGSTKNGNISVSLQTGRHDIDYIVMRQPGAEEKIPLDSILYYTVQKERYFLKLVPLYFDGPQNLLFVRELSHADSRIKLYELYVPKGSSDNNQAEYLHFLSFSGFSRLETVAALSRTLTPDFDKKMSARVKDCAALAEKIRQKQKGYFLPRVNLTVEKRVSVLLRIINEYNDCH